MVIRMTIRRLRRSALPPSTVVGSSLLVADSAAMLVEGTDFQGLLKMYDQMEEMLPIDQRTALMYPTGDKQTWEDALTALADSDPAHCTTMVRWRRSQNGGRPWARPQKLQQDLIAATQRAKSSAAAGTAASRDAARSALISLSGPSLGADPAAVREAILRQVVVTLGRPLHPSSPGCALQADQWAGSVDDSGIWDGKIRIKVKTEAEIKSIHAALGGLPIWQGSEWTMLQVTNFTLPALAQGRSTACCGRGFPKWGPPCPQRPR